jgi:uncharacterized protein (DUF1684 family)
VSELDDSRRRQYGDLRRAKDDFFARDPQSPLTREQKRAFSGLKYVPENPALAVEAEVEVYPHPQEIHMQTSTGDVQTYTRYGRLRFAVDDQPAELTIYATEDGYFLPFVDSLAPAETYGGGRYLEPEPLGGGRFRVDFNLAYNTYCAYNDAWSCPLTPFENHIKVPIKAGEKNFHE